MCGLYPWHTRKLLVLLLRNRSLEHAHTVIPSWSYHNAHMFTFHSVFQRTQHSFSLHSKCRVLFLCDVWGSEASLRRMKKNETCIWSAAREETVVKQNTMRKVLIQHFTGFLHTAHYSVIQYSVFIDIVLTKKGRCLIWHCILKLALRSHRTNTNNSWSPPYKHFSTFIHCWPKCIKLPSVIDVKQ